MTRATLLAADLATQLALALTVGLLVSIVLAAGVLLIAA